MKLGSGICKELLNFSFEKLYSLIKEFLFNDKTFNLYYIIILSSKGKWEGLNHVYVDSSIKFSLQLYEFIIISQMLHMRWNLKINFMRQHSNIGVNSLSL